MPAGYAVSEAARQAGLTVHQVRTYVNADFCGLECYQPCAEMAAH
jgi:hypothetical protein